MSFIKENVPVELIDRLYTVGGYVRDQIMGVSDSHDIDIVLADSKPEDYDILIANGFKQVDNKTFPVFTKFVGAMELQVAAGRAEKKIGLGHAGFEVITGVSIDDDLVRRDFTCNAVCRRVSDGSIYDPLNGIADIEKGILRACGPAFVDDPERAFRALRFAAKLNFKIEKNTLTMIKECAKEFDSFATERVGLELMKAMSGALPSEFFRLMVEVNIGQEFFPEIFDMVSIPAGPTSRFHPEGETVFDHSMLVLDCLRLAIKQMDGNSDRIPSFFAPGKAGPVELYAVIGPGDTRAPVMTIMLIGED